MSIYNDPKEYAQKTFTTTEQAEIRCKYFNELQAIIHEAKKCPKCNQHTLEIEGGSYEEGTHDFVYCENDKFTVLDEDDEEYLTDCGFISAVEKKYEPINHWYDFDEVLAFSIDIEKSGKDKVENIIGCTWNEFVNSSNEKLNV